MKIFNDKGKIIFEGAFDDSKIDFTDEDTALGEDFFLRYTDKNIHNSDMHNALNDFMTDVGFFGVDSDLTKLYLFCGVDGAPCVSVLCKPVIFDYDAQNKHEKAMWQKEYNESNDMKEKAWIRKIMEENEKGNRECADDQADRLEELDRDGGYEVTTFSCELTDAEQKQLEKAMNSMSVRVGV